MMRRVQMLVATTLLAAPTLFASDAALRTAPVLLASGQALKAAPPKPTASKPKTPHKAPTKTHAKRFKVQYRMPNWRLVTMARNQTVANNIKRVLVRQGFQVKLKHRTNSQIAVLDRMMHWHTKAVVPNPATAQRLASILRAHGFQARVV